MMPQRGDMRAELGFSLIEVIVLCAIVALVAGFGAAALAARPARAAATAITFAGLVSEARALAAVSDPVAGGGSGATIGVRRDGERVVVTVYAGRPIAGGPAPTPATGSVPLTTPVGLELVEDGVLVEPPFAIFVSAAGRASVAAPFTVGRDAPLAREPACPLLTGIVIAFRDAGRDLRYPVSCEVAQVGIPWAPAAGSP